MDEETEVQERKKRMTGIEPLCSTDDTSQFKGLTFLFH